MSEFEYLTLISTLRSEAQSYVMMFFTVWSAFLIAVYLVSAKLSLAYSAVLTVLYTFFLIIPMRALATNLNEIIRMYNRYFTDFPDAVRPVSGSSTSMYILFIVLLFAWITSIFFLAQRRKAIEPGLDNTDGTGT